MIAIARAARAGPGGASSTIGANSVWLAGAKPGAGDREDSRAGCVPDGFDCSMSEVFDTDDAARGFGVAGGGPAALAIAAIVITIAPSAAISSRKKGPINWPEW